MAPLIILKITQPRGGGDMVVKLKLKGIVGRQGKSPRGVWFVGLSRGEGGCWDTS